MRLYLLIISRLLPIYAIMQVQVPNLMECKGLLPVKFQHLSGLRMLRESPFRPYVINYHFCWVTHRRFGLDETGGLVRNLEKVAQKKKSQISDRLWTVSLVYLEKMTHNITIFKVAQIVMTSFFPLKNIRPRDVPWDRKEIPHERPWIY